MSDASAYRALPPVDALAAHDALSDAPACDALKRDAARDALDAARDAIRRGAPAPEADALAAHAARWLAEALRPSLVPVVNATGILVHTNLGRAPLCADALTHALGPCTLEYDLEAGARGSRRVHAQRQLQALSGAEASLVVNNNAGAVMLTLAALARGREVVVGRGELVEIGGSFRVPEILEVSGARLVEVGTTNKTWLRDYERAIGPDTAAVLRVHPSNYEIRGFAHRPEPEALAALARERGVLFLHDLGSGTFGPLPAPLEGADRVRRAVACGTDVATFSGDKVLGGPQAGVIVGRSAAVERLAHHPMARALRPDKLTLAALEYTLSAYRAGALDRVPVARMLQLPLPALTARAEALRAALGDVPAELAVAPCDDAVGGGSHPGETFPGVALTVRPTCRGASSVAARLRAGAPPVIPVVRGGRLWLHLRTIAEDQDDAIAAALRHALAP